MDFMSRLDSDVSAIDFNSTCSSTSSATSSTGLVKIHKRERSPLSQATSPSSSTSDGIKKKKYKLVENSYLTKSKITSYLSTTSSSTTSSSSTPSSTSSDTTINSQTQSGDNSKTIPEGRAEFLKMVSFCVKLFQLM